METENSEILRQAARAQQAKLDKEARQAEVDKGEEEATKKELRKQGMRRFMEKRKAGTAGDTAPGSALGDTFGQVLGNG